MTISKLSDPEKVQKPGEAGRTLEVVRQNLSLGAAGDLDYGLEMLATARTGGLRPTLRLYRPEPTVAFGQRDARLSGFAAAEAACRDLGFTPLIRKAGGRAAAYHQGCLVLDHVEPHRDAIAGSQTRFRFFGELLAGALRSAGVDAAVGEVPGEYCPGEFSVHGNDPQQGGHQIKLVGTAQRVVSGGWLFSSVIVVEDPVPIRQVLTAVYDALGLEWKPVTAGAVTDLVPQLNVAAIENAVLDAYESYAGLVR